MQLVAYGAQDIYLTGNPQITFFKVVYRRHTNFSMEAIQQTWDGTSTGSSNNRCSATISRNGDLVHRMYFEILCSVHVDTNNPGSWFVEDVEVEIGGQKIDKHTGEWMETWAELTESNPTGTVCDGSSTWGTTSTSFQKMSGMGGVDADGNLVDISAIPLYIPLQFWFCRNPGLALPLIALQYHEVKVILNFRGDSALATSQNNLWCDYIYLDTDERRRFAQVSHEYLIEQIQSQSLAAGGGNINFNHPVKELIWNVAQTQNGGRTVVAATGLEFLLKLNGHDRFAARDYRYFTRTQVWEHHSGGGGVDSNAKGSGKFNDSIGVYSFALKPEEHQPSGTCNFSRIDNAQLTSTSNTVALNVYAVNYNVLRIMSGMGGLAYSN